MPLSLGERAQGLFAVGERASGAPFAEEDRDFAFSLGRQALGALESVRLHRIRAEKEHQDRELAFARDIQRSLFPPAPPRLAGLALAAVSVPSQQVGGDHYDFIPLPNGRFALAVADVSGKGTPASLLMASVHASLRALAGTMDPAALMERLNRFLFDSTQAHRYVTMFYAELDPASRRLVYVNAGHVPPCLLSASDEEIRLGCGGPVVGLLEDVAFEVGTVELGSGDVVAMVSDGVTEACSRRRPRVRRVPAVRQPAQQPGRERRGRAGGDRGRGPCLDRAGRLRRRPDGRRPESDVRSPCRVP